MKRLMTAATAVALVAGLTACGGDSGAQTVAGGSDGVITLGFSQVGAESGWRAANTKSIQDTLTAENGFDLKFSDAQQKQENQIQAIRTYITQGVDVIAFSPVVETGWDAVLQEAKTAGIPVILTDRAVDSDDETLYESFIGSDFVKEGETAGQWVTRGLRTARASRSSSSRAPRARPRRSTARRASSPPSRVRTSRSSTARPATSRGPRARPSWRASSTSHDDIGLVFAHNDDMGLGAIEAIEAAGLEPGKDIQIVTIDAVKDGMQALADGKINYIVECNPLLGPDLAEIAKAVIAGEEVEKRIVVKDEAFDQAAAKEALPTREY